MTGRVLAHYNILERIGSGGMGDVYLAEDLRLHRRVALKVLSEDSRASATRSARFEREMRAIAAINHPNVVTLYDVEEADGLRFLAMELVEGDTLAEIAMPGERLSLSRFLDIAIPLVDGLRAAHALGIAHRDLKPRNVMIDREGRVKLLDFGLAAWRQSGRSSDADRDLTRAGAIVGTPAYLSPEQLCGEPVDPRSDLFQLGVLFYELLAGRRPFGGSTPSELTSSILRDDPEPLRSLRPDLPERLCATIHHCLEKRVADRWQSADEVLAALRALDLESQVQRITGQFHAMASRRRRRLVTLGWAAAVLAAVAGASAGIWWRDRAAGPQLEPHIVPVVSWSGQQSDAQLSPDREWVSFLDSVFGPGDVYLQRLDGGQPQRLSEGASTAIGHVWSEDGQRVALLVENSGRHLVQIVRPLAGAAERVLPLPHDVSFQRLVRWLGSTVYLEGLGRLYRLDLATGSHDVLLTSDVASLRTQFDVSADGQRAVYSLASDGRMAAQVMELSDGAVSLLTLHEGNDFYPRWIGPGSDTVVVRSDRGGRSDLWIVPIESPQRASPLLSGSRDEGIDFASQTESVATFRESVRNTDLHLYDPAGSPDMMPVTTGAASSAAATVLGAGELMVYQESDPRLRRSLYPFGSRIVMAWLRPGELVSERRGIAEGAQPILSPSGDRVALLRKLDAGVALVVHEVETQYEQVVTERFAFPGLSIATYEIDRRNAVWETDDELLFVAVGAEGTHELRRWSAGGAQGARLVHSGGSLRELADLVPPRGGEPGYFLDLPTATELYFGPGPHELVVWAIDAGGSTRPFARVQKDDPGGGVRLLGRRGGAAVLAVAEMNSDWSFRLEIRPATAQGELELGVIDRSVSTSVVLDDEGERVLFSSKDPRDDVYNLFEQSLVTGERRQLTFNRRPGVLFSDFVVLPERRVLLAITALTSTINLLELRHKDASQAGETQVVRIAPPLSSPW
ncbi:MAG TPA: protein kinase [Thermoanaerobaculia bacterium]|nr:protein kinase [Thermoanaerobaculia bacterium]